MTILFLTGSTSKETKAAYVTALADQHPNSIYLNINNINQVFSQPETSEFMHQYSYHQRILQPGHEAVLGIALDNIPLGKTVILDGDFDYQLTADCVREKFPQLLNSQMIALYFQTGEPAYTSASFDSLTQLFQATIIKIHDTSDLQSDLAVIAAAANIITAETIRREGLLVMAAGVAGVAKTTHLKKTCAKIKGSVYIDKDTVAVKFLEIVNEGMPSPYYNMHVKSQSYEVIFAFAVDNLKLNKIILLDGCFGDRLTGALISNHLATSQYPTTLMYFQCSGPVQRINIVERNVQRDLLKLNDLPADRRNNLQKHVKDFSQIDPASTVLYVDTEFRDNTDANVQKILSYLLQSCLITLKMNVRIIPYDEKNCAITTEEAQGGLTEFLVLLARTIENDQRMQKEALQRHQYKTSAAVYSIYSRNSIWRASPLCMADPGLKLPSVILINGQVISLKRMHQRSIEITDVVSEITIAKTC